MGFTIICIGGVLVGAYFALTREDHTACVWMSMESDPPVGYDSERHVVLVERFDLRGYERMFVQLARNPEFAAWFPKFQFIGFGSERVVRIECNS